MSLPMTMVGGVSASSYSITNSARFNGTSDYLSRTPGSAGSTTARTISMWVKPANISAAGVLFIAGNDTNNDEIAYFEGSTTNTLVWYVQTSGSVIGLVRLVNYFRDPSAWYHLVFVYDSANATGASRMRIYVNGVLGVKDGTSTVIAQNNAGYICSTTPHKIGTHITGANCLNGYLSDCYLIDGQALTPTSFGKTDANGVWVPIKYSGTYGTNGCKLAFGSSGALGTDTSGNVNTWTVSGSPVQNVDTPTNNYCTMNSLDFNGTQTLSNGNLTVSSSTNGNNNVRGTIAVSSGKYCCSTTVNAVGDAVRFQVAMTAASSPISGNLPIYSISAQSNGSGTTSFGYVDGGGAWNVVGTVSETWAVNDVFHFAYDADSGKAWMGRNGTWYNSGNPSAGTGQIYTFPANTPMTPLAHMNVSGTTNTCTWNFQSPQYAPSGFNALCTANLPAVSIPKPSAHFNTVLAAGASIKSSSEALYTYFLEWIKDRANSNNHQLIDTGRGTSAVLQSNTTAAETTYSAPSGTSVGWVWNAGGAAVTNNAGSISAQVSANAAAGFSIATYTATGTTGTVGHGLGATPSMVISFCRSNAGYSHAVWHKSLTSAAYAVLLDTTGAQASNNLYWNSTAPTSTVVTVGGGGNANVANGYTQTLYCFAGIPGYSKFGSYVGNGSNDGPFVYCGFRPRWIMIKNCTDSVYHWRIIDTARNTYNVSGNTFYSDLNNAEDTPASSSQDITSNGFKVRSLSDNINGSTYIFAAFAELPFGGSNVAPCPAR